MIGWRLAYAIPPLNEWELAFHTVQLSQRKHVYEDFVGRTRVEAGVRMYRFSQTIDHQHGIVLVYKPHIHDHEVDLDLRNWPVRLYRGVPPPLLLVLESIQESLHQMQINLDSLSFRL